MEGDDDSGLARLAGSNVFTGNQAVNGAVSATSFSGDGSGLTNVSATTAAMAFALNCTGCIGNAQLGVNYAGSTSKGGSALLANNAMALGGVPPASYARLDIGNTFSGRQVVSGNFSASGNLVVAGSVSVGNGTPITGHLSTLFNPVFPALGPGKCAITSLTVAGVSDGDVVTLGIPNDRMLSGTGAFLIYSAWVIATDNMTLRVCNVGTSPQKYVGTGAIRIDIWKH